MLKIIDSKKEANRYLITLKTSYCFGETLALILKKYITRFKKFETFYCINCSENKILENAKIFPMLSKCWIDEKNVSSIPLDGKHIISEKMLSKSNNSNEIVISFHEPFQIEFHSQYLTNYWVPDKFSLEYENKTFFTFFPKSNVQTVLYSIENVIDKEKNQTIDKITFEIYCKSIDFEEVIQELKNWIKDEIF